MRRIILDRADPATVPFSAVNQCGLILAKVGDRIKGVVVKEANGWIVRIGGSAGANGHHNSLRECIESCLEYGYEFFTEDQRPE